MENIGYFVLGNPLTLFAAEKRALLLDRSFSLYRPGLAVLFSAANAAALGVGYEKTPSGLGRKGIFSNANYASLLSFRVMLLFFRAAVFL